MAEKNTILINRMYVGEYLDTYIGHEFINTYRSDNGNHYIYVNAYGLINKAHRKSIDTVLLVRGINANVFEVLGYASGLELYLSNTAFDLRHESLPKAEKEREYEAQIQRIRHEKIQYGNLYLDQLFEGQPNTTYITYRTKDYHAIRKGTVLRITDNFDLKDKDTIYISGINFAKTSLHMYVDSDNKNDAFNTISSLLSNSEYWEDSDTTEPVKWKGVEPNFEHNILDVIRKREDELVFSNWLAFYLEEYRDIMNSFARDVLGIPDFSVKYKVDREHKNIDIYIDADSHLIVIENKIKSKINGIQGQRHDLTGEYVQSQLSKYYDYANNERDNRTLKCYIFLPDYNYCDEGLEKFVAHEKYTIVRYSTIYDFFLKYNIGHPGIPYMDDFVKALKRHTKPIYRDLFGEMNDMLVRKIQMLNKKN